jgi:hypothetical protein
MSSRTNQRQIWADAEFVKRLENIKAKRTLMGKPVKNVGDLTKELAHCRSFEDLEDEVLGFDKKQKEKMNIRIRFDGSLP